MDQTTCPNCGKTFEHKADDPMVTCPNCKAQLVLEGEMEFVCANCKSDVAVEYGSPACICPVCSMVTYFIYSSDGSADNIQVIPGNLN